MIELENYKSNLDIVDKFDVENIPVIKSAIYTGNTEYINEHIKERKHDSPLLAAAVLGLDNTEAPYSKYSEFSDIWTDIDAQELYINTKPTCFLIYGNAGSGAYSLGEAISKKYNSIHICPRNILSDEIAQNSPTGRTWDFNMRHNKVCSFDMILTMLKIKLDSEAVKHRGYVISDLPLVTCSRHPLYFINSLHSEEAFLEIDDMLFDLIRNLKKKKPKKPPGSAHSSLTSEVLVQDENEEEEDEQATNVDDQQAEEEVEEEEDKPAELPKFVLNSCSDVIVNKKSRYESKQATFLRQLKEIFNLYLTPDVMIHISCPQLALVTKRTHKYINYITGQMISEPFISDYIAEPRWPPKYDIVDYVQPHDTRVFHPKYNCRSPSNYEDQVVEQICNYTKYIHPFIENKLKDYDPKVVIVTDGRTSTDNMMHLISERLLLLSMPPIVLPEPLKLDELPEDMEEFWAIAAETNVIESGDIKFKYYESPWYNRCPVELKLRRSVIGNPKYAVKFFKHVYLMSSLDHFISFCKNPRPFLKLKYLEPTCRVIVIGTKNSGKTTVSQCLSWIFDAPIIDYNTVVKKEKEKKYNTYASTILSEIIPTIEDGRILEWKRAESERTTKLNKWCNYVLGLLNAYLPLLMKKNARKQKPEQLTKEEEELIGEEGELKAEEEEVKEDESIIEEEFEPGFLNKFNALRMQLSFLPFIDSIEECTYTVANQNISQYAPIELKTVIKKPPIPVIGDEDVTVAISKYIVANDLEKEFEPSAEEIMTEIVKLITTIDIQHQEATQFDQLYGKYIIDGFPSDPEYWGYIHDPKIFPDYTIALIENREIDQKLHQYYTNSENYAKHYERRILMANDPLIHTKLQAVGSTESRLQYTDMQTIVNNLVNESVDFISSKDLLNQNLSEANLENEFITSFTEAIEKFREDWDSIKLKLEEKSKSFIEIELDNKTDVEIIEEMLLKLRQSYRSTGVVSEDEEPELPDADEDDEAPKDLLTYNDPRFLCETNIYCPIAYYNYNILWEGKPEFSLKYDSRSHYFCKEEFVELFRKDITKYQRCNQPYKKIPKLKICVIGAIGSGLSTLSKKIAKELGLLYIDFSCIVNDYMMPRHYKKVGRKYENVFVDEPLDEEAVLEFQMDEENENLVSDILGNETELRRMINNYFERGTPILPALMQKIIKKIWFDPFTTTGFVLDGYPKIPNDLEDMLVCYCIPDMVINLESTAEVAISRISSIMFNKWKSQQNEAKRVAKIRFDDEHKLWLHTITKNVIAKILIEEIVESMFYSQSEHVKGLSAESLITDANPTGSKNVDPTLLTAYNEMLEEYPEPKDTNVWETFDDARERIEARIEGIFDTDDENIGSLQEMFSEQRIRTVTVDAVKPFNKVFRYTLAKLTSLKNRNESFFEQTYIIQQNIAEELILKGFYFFSKFHRLCPVYIFENSNVILNNYKISRQKRTVFTVIHRSYVYFLSNKDSVTKFRANPLKYITRDSIKDFFEYPLRIGVIGAPKSGKSTLAAKLAKQYGLLYVSSGEAVRSVLRDYGWTQMSLQLAKCLRSGKLIYCDQIVRAIHTVALDHRTYTYGFVFDGLPASPYEAQGLVKNGLFPTIIFDIHASESKVLENSQNEIYNDILKYMPPYPGDLIKIRYIDWNKNLFKIRHWIDEDYQNLFRLDGNQSRWHVLEEANKIVRLLTNKIHSYVSNVEKTVVHASFISNDHFQERQSQYKNFCPICFHLKVYRQLSQPGDKKSVVQYKDKFYWICPEHLNMVMEYPEYYLKPKDIQIPEIPVVTKIVNIDYVYENGVCLVTYAENLPSQKIVMGTNEFAASYAGRSYLFCSDKCLTKFLCKPYLYKNISVFKAITKFPKLSINKLPNIGYLEQTLGNLLTDACCAVNVFRPKYPGLSFQLSALIHIALYLKTHNPDKTQAEILTYRKVLKVFEARCKLMLNVGLRLRSRDNPFASYPKCHHREPTLRPGDEELHISSIQIQRPSSIRHRSSNYVQMHKPSYVQALSRGSRIISQIQRPENLTFD